MLKALEEMILLMKYSLDNGKN